MSQSKYSICSAIDSGGCLQPNISNSGEISIDIVTFSSKSWEIDVRSAQSVSIAPIGSDTCIFLTINDVSQTAYGPCSSIEAKLEVSFRQEEFKFSRGTTCLTLSSDEGVELVGKTCSPAVDAQFFIIEDLADELNQNNNGDSGIALDSSQLAFALLFATMTLIFLVVYVWKFNLIPDRVSDLKQWCNRKHRTLLADLTRFQTRAGSQTL